MRGALGATTTDIAAHCRPIPDLPGAQRSGGLPDGSACSGEFGIRPHLGDRGHGPEAAPSIADVHSAQFSDPRKLEETRWRGTTIQVGDNVSATGDQLCVGWSRRAATASSRAPGVSRIPVIAVPIVSSSVHRSEQRACRGHYPGFT